jgi:hypothetical protein
MEIWESCQTFWYSTQGKNPTRTAPDLIFLSSLQSVQNCSFQPTRHRAKSHRTRTIDWMKASKYPLESCGCPLPFWYSTLSQISNRTAPDFNLLIAARSQGRIDVVIRFFLFGGNAARLSVAICYRAPKSYAPTHNLATYHRTLFVMAFCCAYVSEQNFELNLPLWQISFYSNFESF